MNIYRFVIFIIILLAYLSLVGCNENQVNVNQNEFEQSLRLIDVPNMSTTILDFNELEQLKWLSEIYNFEIKTLQTKTSELSVNDLDSVRTHLSQVFGIEQVEILIQGFYNYDEETKLYYVPDGSWFIYDNNWTDSRLTIVDGSDSLVVIKLTGKDNYGENLRDIDHSFSINNGQLLLEKRTFNN